MSDRWCARRALEPETAGRRGRSARIAAVRARPSPWRLRVARGQPRQCPRGCHRDNHWCVIAVIEVAGDAKNERQRGKQDKEREPAAINAEDAASEPQGTHRIALHDWRMAGDAFDGKAKDESLARLPGKIEAPAHPQCTGAKVYSSQEERKDQSAGKAGRV